MSFGNENLLLQKKEGGLVPTVYAPTGRGYCRHPSGMGSVMFWNDNGTARKTLILDVAYHNIGGYWSSGSVDVPGITNYTAKPFNIDGTLGYYIKGSSDSTTSGYNGQTDAVLDSHFNWRDAGTSKSNTDAMMTQSKCSDTHYAAGFCRSKLVDGVGCDLPNMQTLVRIFCDRATIHSLDATDTSDRWSSWFSNRNVWCSSEYNSIGAWCVDYNGSVNPNSKNSGGVLCVVPVQDL